MKTELAARNRVTLSIASTARLTQPVTGRITQRFAQNVPDTLPKNALLTVSHHWLRMIVCTLALGLSLTASLARADDSLLYVGESRFINDKSITDVVVGVDSVLSAKPVRGRGVVFTGVAPGDTTVKIWRGKQYNSVDVHVSARNLPRLKQQVTELVHDLPGVTVSIMGDQVVLQGDQLEKSIKQRVDAIAAIFPGVVNLTATLEQGTALTHKMVYLDVRIVEVSSSLSKDIGIQWNGSGISGPKAAAMGDVYKSGLFQNPGNPLAEQVNTALPRIRPLRGYLGIASVIDSKINLMQEEGVARVLARPLLSCKSGGKASFLSGGQVPYQTVGATGTPSVEFKDYGIKLDIQPVITAEGINANILTEVSSLDKSVSVNGVPGLLSRKTETDFVVAQGETIVLSGLVNAETGKSISSLPGLGQLPLIKHLFRDKSSSHKQTELVVFVTPHIYDLDESHPLSIQPQDLQQHFSHNLSPLQLLPDSVRTSGSVASSSSNSEGMPARSKGASVVSEASEASEETPETQVQNPGSQSKPANPDSVTPAVATHPSSEITPSLTESL